MLRHEQWGKIQRWIFTEPGPSVAGTVGLRIGKAMSSSSCRYYVCAPAVDELVLGIDVGTTKSCVAVLLAKHQTRLVANVAVAGTVPSMVAFPDVDHVTPLAGDTAKHQHLLNPRGTIYGFKRLMGRRFDSEEVVKTRGRVPYEIVKGTNTEDAWVAVGDKSYSPSHLTSLLLAKLKALAEHYTGQPIRKAVITVPATATDAQRLAARHAGDLAGLDVLRVVNETAAALMASTLWEGNIADRQRVAVFDMGGGTCEASVVDIYDGISEVVASASDNLLGGEDFDETLLHVLLEELKKKKATRKGVDLSQNALAVQHLRDGAAAAKKALDHLPACEIALLPPSITRHNMTSSDFTHRLTRDTYDALTKPLVDRIVAPCELVPPGPERLRHVLLVGGMSGAPAVVNMVREVFGLDPQQVANPAEAIAVGAAIQGGVRWGTAWRPRM